MTTYETTDWYRTRRQNDALEALACATEELKRARDDALEALSSGPDMEMKTEVEDGAGEEDGPGEEQPARPGSCTNWQCKACRMHGTEADRNNPQEKLKPAKGMSYKILCLDCDTARKVDPETCHLTAAKFVTAVNTDEKVRKRAEQYRKRAEHYRRSTSPPRLAPPWG